MGVNQSFVSNHTEDILYIATFNNSELLYKHYRELRQVPSSGQPIEVDGLAGGNAVKVGVIYNYLNGNFIYDLFRVKDGATLTIQVVTQGAGVTKFEETDGVTVLQRGKFIALGNDITTAVLQGLQNAVQGLPRVVDVLR